MAALVEGIMSRRKHPQHGFQACLGVISLRRPTTTRASKRRARAR